VHNKYASDHWEAYNLIDSRKESVSNKRNKIKEEEEEIEKEDLTLEKLNLAKANLLKTKMKILNTDNICSKDLKST